MSFGERTSGPIGLDVGPRSVAAVQFATRGGKRHLVAAANVEREVATGATPSWSLSPLEAGRVEAVLYRQGFIGRDIVTAVPDERLLASILELPPRSSGAPLEQLARVEMARTHKQEPEEFEMACWEIPTPARASEATYMMAAGCTRADADSILAPLDEAGLRVCALDARPWAMSRARTAAGALDASRVCAVLDLGESGALLTILHGQTPVYERFMRDAGLGALRLRLGEQLQIEAETVGYLLRTVLDGGEAQAGRDGSGTEKETAAVFEEHVGSLYAELAAAGDYVGHRYPPGLQELVLTGAIGSGAGVLARLGSELGIPTRVIRARDLAEIPASFALAAADATLTVAAGLALAPQRRAA